MVTTRHGTGRISGIGKSPIPRARITNIKVAPAVDAVRKKVIDAINASNADAFFALQSTADMNGFAHISTTEKVPTVVHNGLCYVGRA